MGGTTDASPSLSPAQRPVKRALEHGPMTCRVLLLTIVAQTIARAPVLRMGPGRLAPDQSVRR